jgi:hypothetical protein
VVGNEIAHRGKEYLERFDELGSLFVVGLGRVPQRLAHAVVKQFDGMSAMMKGMAGMGMRERVQQMQAMHSQMANPAMRLGKPKGDTGRRLTADERRKQKKQREKEARRKRRGD